MCRYSDKPYKYTFACFTCRRVFKKDEHASREGAVCPNCGEALAWMGRDFQAPRQRDIKAWAVVKELWQAGIRFNSCGCGGPGWRPRTKRDTRKYLATLRKTRANQIGYPRRSDQPTLEVERWQALNGRI